jgi:hypothetical protein
MNSDDISKLIQSISRSAEIGALTVAMGPKPTCHVCGLFASLMLEFPYNDWQDANGNSYCDPHFCDQCHRNIPEINRPKVQDVAGAPAVRRLNALLRGE